MRHLLALIVLGSALQTPASPAAATPARESLLSVTTGEHLPPVQPPQIPRLCPLGPVFDPYCWWGIGPP